MTVATEPAIAAYRNRSVAHGLYNFELNIRQSNIAIACSSPLQDLAREVLTQHRKRLEAYIEAHRVFLSSLKPVSVDSDAPWIVQSMADAARKASVGPMAAVAGAIADAVGLTLIRRCDEVIVENGGDIFIRVARRRVIGIDAANSPLSYRVGIVVTPEHEAVGVCTSSGTSGGSLSFGRADAVCVVARSAALADAVATATANLIRKPSDIDSGLRFARAIPDVLGAIVIVGSNIGACGAIELKEL